MKIIYLAKENFNELIGKGKVLVDFYADWCGPCKMIAPILEELQDQIQIIKVNVDNHEEIASEYGIMSIPSLIFMKDGKEKKRLVGYREQEEIELSIKEL